MMFHEVKRKENIYLRHETIDDRVQTTGGEKHIKSHILESDGVCYSSLI